MSGRRGHPAARSDPFGAVVGAGRGLAEVPASQEQLHALEVKLTQTAAELAEAQAQVGDLQATIGSLRDELDVRTGERDEERRLARYAEKNEDLAVFERDRARYAAMRTGEQDPCTHGSFVASHQGDWTPGRPYLAFQHALHPRTRECYHACTSGAPIGEIPGPGRHWRRCLDDACPLPESAPEHSRHTYGGAGLRKTVIRWGDRREEREPRQLGDNELSDAIGFLRVNAADMCAEEEQLNVPLVPCPSNAYVTAAAWISDTPLMRALVNEQRRRRRGGRVAARAPAGAET